MKPHPRIRKSIKWSGGAAVVLLIVLFLGSGTWGLELSSGRFRNWPEWKLTAVHQTFVISHADRGGILAQQGLIHRVNSLKNDGVFATRYVNIGEAWMVYIPIWMPLALVTPIAACAWILDLFARRREQRVLRNLCPACGYSRAGIAKAAACPECDAAPGAIA